MLPTLATIGRHRRLVESLEQEVCALRLEASDHLADANLQQELWIANRTCHKVEKNSEEHELALPRRHRALNLLPGEEALTTAGGDGDLDEDVADELHWRLR